MIGEFDLGEPISKFKFRKKLLMNRAEHERSIAVAHEVVLGLRLVKIPDLRGVNLPDRFSLAQWQTPIQNQGGRGTCWAFAAAGALEAAYHRHLARPVKVSEEYIYHINRTVRIEANRLEYPCSLWDGQGNATVLFSLQHDAIVGSQQANAYAATRVAIEAIPKALGISGDVTVMSQKESDEFEFSDLHLPLLSRVNCRYRVKSWKALGYNPSISDIKATLKTGHEVVADVPGHTFLIIGYDDGISSFIVKNSWGEAGPISVAYDGSSRFGSILYGSYIESVEDPTFVQNHACWIGKWYDRQDREMYLRRHHSFGNIADRTKLGAIFLGPNGSQIEGQFQPDGMTAKLGIGNTQATYVLNHRDPYVLRSSNAPAFSRFRIRYVSAWERSDQHAWAANHGVPSSSHQALFDRMVREGFRPITVQGTADVLGSQLSSIWINAPSPAWRAHHGLTSAQHQEAFDRNAAEGYKMVDVGAYSEDGEARFTSIWEQGIGGAWQARHGLDAAGFQSAFDQLAANDFVVRKIVGYRVGIERRFAALWEHAPTERSFVQHGMTDIELQRKNSSLAAGLHLAWVSGYPDTGRARFAAVWSSSVSNAELTVGLDANAHQMAFDQFSGQGLRPRVVCPYETGV
jgi:Bacterial tandem repeat domain 1/Papain family cysteine protease